MNTIKQQGGLPVAPRLGAEGGFSLFEVSVAMVVLTVGVVSLAGLLTQVSGLDRTSRDRGIAYNGARAVVESMRNTEFSDVFATFNEDPSDDPGGEGTAPGHVFEVAGLDTESGVAVGEIFFPTHANYRSELREDIVAPKLGMPDGLDLNGDGEIDSSNHASDYVFLPVRIVVTWRTSTGTFKVDFTTNLTER